MKKPDVNRKQIAQIRICDKDYHFNGLDEIDCEIISKKINKDIEKKCGWNPEISLKMEFRKEVYTNHH